MPEEQDKKQEVKQEPVKEELPDEELEGVSGGVDLAAVAIPMYDGHEGWT